MHDGGRNNGHNDDAINDSGGSGNGGNTGETHEERPEHMPGVPGVPWKPTTTYLSTQDQGLIFYKLTCYRRVIKGSLENRSN